MDRPLDVYRKILEWIDARRPFAVALVLDAEGSTPRGKGAKAVIDGTGAIFGTIGGGVVESEVQRRAVEACRTGVPAVIEVSLRGAVAGDESALCGGRVRVLLDPSASSHREAYASALSAMTRRDRGVLRTAAAIGGEVTVTVGWLSAERMTAEGMTTEVVAADLGFPGAEALQACLAREEVRLYRRDMPGSTLEALVEPIIAEPRLLIVGGGHIGQALAAQAAVLGFEVTVLDDRPEFTAAQLYPDGVMTRCGDIAKEVEAYPMGDDAYVVIVTRGHREDAAALAACIRSFAVYVGMIGSRRKVTLLRADFVESGLATAEEFDRVFAPVGLDIGAVTVPEIATSIAAQLVAARRKGIAAARIGSMKRA